MSFLNRTFVITILQHDVKPFLKFIAMIECVYFSPLNADFYYVKTFPGPACRMPICLDTSTQQNACLC